MADKSRFPQIPATVWWGIRGILNRTPKAVLDEQYLSIQLNVQQAAAKQYVSELQSVGILDAEYKATELAQQWKFDDQYAGAVDELLTAVYPQSLRDLAPSNETDRTKATRWFQQSGLGEGAARNKAATYFLLGSPTPNEAPPKAASSKTLDFKGAKPVSPSKEKSSKVQSLVREPIVKPASSSTSGDTIPLNVNVQIHISADAGFEQIEAIFSAMRRYLHDRSDS